MAVLRLHHCKDQLDQQENQKDTLNYMPHNSRGKDVTLLSITVIIIIIAVVMHMLTVILLTAYCYVIM